MKWMDNIDNMKEDTEAEFIKKEITILVTLTLTGTTLMIALYWVVKLFD